MEIKTFKEKVEVPKAQRGHREIKSPVILAIIDWQNTDDKTLLFKCKDFEESKKIYANIDSFKRRRGGDFIVFRRGKEVYLIKA